MLLNRIKAIFYFGHAKTIEYKYQCDKRDDVWDELIRMGIYLKPEGNNSYTLSHMEKGIKINVNSNLETLIDAMTRLKNRIFQHQGNIDYFKYMMERPKEDEE